MIAGNGVTEVSPNKDNTCKTVAVVCAVVASLGPVALLGERAALPETGVCRHRSHTIIVI